MGLVCDWSMLEGREICRYGRKGPQRCGELASCPHFFTSLKGRSTQDRHKLYPSYLASILVNVKAAAALFAVDSALWL